MTLRSVARKKNFKKISDPELIDIIKTKTKNKYYIFIFVPQNDKITQFGKIIFLNSNIKKNKHFKNICEYSFIQFPTNLFWQLINDQIIFTPLKIKNKK